MSVRRRRDTGKWTADSRDAFGRRRQLAFESRGEARDFEADQRRARRLRRFTAFDPETTLEAYAKGWLATRSIKPTSRERYAAVLRLHVLPDLGRLRIVEVSRERVRRFLAAKLGDAAASCQGRRAARTEHRKARPLHRNSIRHMLKVLSGILNAAVSDQVLPANPIQGLGRELFGRTRRGLTHKVRAMDPEQLEAFLQTARQRADTFPAVALMALTGMRLGEAAALRWEDVDWTAGRVSVARQLSGTLKTPESERDVDAPRVLLDLLRDLQAWGREAAFAQGNAPSPWLLFPDLPEHPTAKDATRIGHRVRRDMDRALAAAGLPLTFTPHSLRHTYASRLISDGVSPEYVRRQLGHANIGITLDLYGRWLPMAPPEGALDRLGASLGGPECNESATNGAPPPTLATGTYGGSVASSPRPGPCPRSPCTCT